MGWLKRMAQHWEARSWEVPESREKQDKAPQVLWETEKRTEEARLYALLAQIEQYDGTAKRREIKP